MKDKTKFLRHLDAAVENIGQARRQLNLAQTYTDDSDNMVMPDNSRVSEYHLRQRLEAISEALSNNAQSIKYNRDKIDEARPTITREQVREAWMKALKASGIDTFDHTSFAVLDDKHEDVIAYHKLMARFMEESAAAR